MEVKKYGIRIPFSFESLLDTPKRPGHWEPDPMTKEELADYRKVKKAMKLIKNSKWTYWDRDEGYVMREKRTRKWVYDD